MNNVQLCLILSNHLNNDGADLNSLELNHDFQHSQMNESNRLRFAFMLHKTGRRGRPIGTGIDDSDRIARLAELLRIQPGLKPTTAIRVMGFSDPSAIRRLRDKYKLYTKTSGAGSSAAVTFATTASKAPRPLDPQLPEAMAGQFR